MLKRGGGGERQGAEGRGPMGGLYSVDPRVLSLSSPQLPTLSQLVALPLYFEYPSQETPESSWTFNRGPMGSAWVGSSGVFALLLPYLL